MKKIRQMEGFTLLELVVVILVLSLVAGISLPAMMRGRTAFQLRASGREVVNLFRYAREKAISEQMPLKVVVDRGQQNLVLSDEFGGNARSTRLPNHVTIARLFLEGREVQNEALTIRFLPNGSAEEAQVELRADGSSLRVITDPLTGGARIFLGQGERP
jgi:prepilin-type N-terminal cleavage/methylation domain-containing protein